MGVINLTPDSFSDGGRYRDVDHALEVARAMVEAGAGVVDVGGESTRPGAAPVPAREELRRILPFVERAAADVPAPLSVDTRKAAVAHAALERGAAAINDVSGLSYDPRMGGVVAEAGAGLVLMHMRGGPEDMARRAEYTDVVGEVADELGRAVERALAAGVEREALVVDPGIGFAKGAGHSLALLGDLGPVRALGLPILVGPSRKSFLGAVLSTPVSDRLAGTLAACVAAYFQGARIFRVHDVEPVVQALAVAEAIARERIQREESTLEGSVR
jgi:dihydropteroate synthase